MVLTWFFIPIRVEKVRFLALLLQDSTMYCLINLTSPPLIHISGSVPPKPSILFSADSKKGGLQMLNWNSSFMSLIMLDLTRISWILCFRRFFFTIFLATLKDSLFLSVAMNDQLNELTPSKGKIIFAPVPLIEVYMSSTVEMLEWVISLIQHK